MLWSSPVAVLETAPIVSVSAGPKHGSKVVAIPTCAKRVPRERILQHWASPGEEAELIAAIDDFVARIAAEEQADGRQVQGVGEAHSRESAHA